MFGFVAHLHLFYLREVVLYYRVCAHVYTTPKETRAVPHWCLRFYILQLVCTH